MMIFSDYTFSSDEEKNIDNILRLVYPLTNPNYNYNISQLKSNYEIVDMAEIIQKPKQISDFKNFYLAEKGYIDKDLTGYFDLNSYITGSLWFKDVKLDYDSYNDELLIEDNIKPFVPLKFQANYFPNQGYKILNNASVLTQIRQLVSQGYLLRDFNYIINNNSLIKDIEVIYQSV